jgi:hypothetical protein
MRGTLPHRLISSSGFLVTTCGVVITTLFLLVAAYAQIDS